MPWDALARRTTSRLTSPIRRTPSRRSSEIRPRLETGELHALVNNAAISPKADGGGRLGTLDTDMETWAKVWRVNFMAPTMLARGPDQRT